MEWLTIFSVFQVHAGDRKRASAPAGCVFHSLCLAYLEGDRLYLVFLLDGQVETGLVQPGHLLILQHSDVSTGMDVGGTVDTADQLLAGWQLLQLCPDRLSCPCLFIHPCDMTGWLASQ